jgi:hypothetical protein
MTQKTLTTILDEHRTRMEQAGKLVWDAREIVRLRVKPGPSEDRELFDHLQKLHYVLGGSPIDMDARPIADALDFLNANTCLELDWSEVAGWADDCQWRVRACHGGRNDPEWTTIAIASTVEDALIRTHKVGKV